MEMRWDVVLGLFLVIFAALTAGQRSKIEDPNKIQETKESARSLPQSTIPAPSRVSVGGNNDEPKKVEELSIGNNAPNKNEFEKTGATRKQTDDLNKSEKVEAATNRKQADGDRKFKKESAPGEKQTVGDKKSKKVEAASNGKQFNGDKPKKVESASGGKWADGDTKPKMVETASNKNQVVGDGKSKKVESASGGKEADGDKFKKIELASNGNQAADNKAKRTSAGEEQSLVADDTETMANSLPRKLNSNTLEKSKILVMLPLPFYSHTNNYMPIFRELAHRGHHITMVSPFPQKEPLPNWEDIVTENVLEKMLSSMPSRDFTDMPNNFLIKLIQVVMFADISIKLLGEMAPVKQLFNDDSREFDLVFVEAQFLQEPLVAFGWKFKAPVISLYPSYIVPEVAYYTGNPVFTTTYVPNIYFDTTNDMNFLERFRNSAFAVLKILLYNTYYVPKVDSMMREIFSAKDIPYLGDMLFNVSFTLLDSNPAVVYPYPRANNMREFLGINTKSQTSLSPDLQRILDGADEEGVLLFTLGSHFQTSTLKPHILSSLMYAFGNIPQKVIMKWDKEEPPPNLTNNVYTVKWLPQAAILSHKNCKAFLTHTGVHGVMEAMDHGVPIISLPLFADQKFFARWAEKNGVGMKIDVNTITPEVAHSTVQEVLNNPKYKENAIKISLLIKDAPQPTINEVVYWVEHILRTKGAPHLRPGSLNLWWYQRFGLDVLVVALIAISVPIWVLFVLLRCCFSCCCKKTKKTAEARTKQAKSKKNN